MSQCWARSLDGKRCEFDAAHAGNHGVTISWDDEEAGAVFVTVAPTVPLADVVVLGYGGGGAQPAGVYSADPPPHLRIQPPETEIDPLQSRPAEEVVIPQGTPCISCHHAHQGGGCARCSCNGYIPS